MINQDFMHEAISLADKGMTKTGGGPFGAIIVKENQIVGRGNNRVTINNDPTAHAEITAIREACQNLETFSLNGCEIYTSCEPCPMCLGAIYWARLDKIYYAADQKDAAKIGFDDENFYEELAKPFSERKVPMVQLLRDDAVKVFKAWDENPDKVMY